MNNLNQTNNVSDVSVNTNLSKIKKVYFDSYVKVQENQYKGNLEYKKPFLNTNTELRGGLIDSIEMGNYLNQDNFSILYYFNNSGFRMRKVFSFSSLYDLDVFLKQISLKSNSRELFFTWSSKKKIPVLVSYGENEMEMRNDIISNSSSSSFIIYGINFDDDEISDYFDFKLVGCEQECITYNDCKDCHSKDNCYKSVKDYFGKNHKDIDCQSCTKGYYDYVGLTLRYTNTTHEGHIRYQYSKQEKNETLENFMKRTREKLNSISKKPIPEYLFNIYSGSNDD